MLIDTDVAIHWRDGDPAVTSRIAGLAAVPSISVVTLVELKAGAALDQPEAIVRRRSLERLLRSVPVLPFTTAEADAYGAIVTALGHDRRRVLDRMIAAQAIVAGLALATINAKDFRDIAGLRLEVWESGVLEN